MPILTGGTVLGGGSPTEISGAGVPAAGTASVQTLTIGGTPTGGTFRLSHGPFTTADITWTAVDATLVAAIDSALEALPSIGTGGVAAADVTLTAGIGDVSLTFATKGEQPVVAVASNDLTGTAPTVAVVNTTPGVNPSGTGTGGRVPVGGRYTDTTAGKVYVNTGTALAPTWTVVGTQT
jgi:hypothetical protein